MCTLFLAYRSHPHYPLIFLGNRDEFKNRPSAKAHFWDAHPHVLAGMDLEKGGTWTGLTTQGRMAFITNYRDPTLGKTGSLSRGFLTRDYLIAGENPKAYLEKIHENRGAYDPFNLILGTLEELYYYSNVQGRITPLAPGIYGLSNGLLDEPWYKVVKGKERLVSLLQKPFTLQDLMAILSDPTRAPKEKLPHTGVSPEMEQFLSSTFINGPEYGTRFQTVITIDQWGKGLFLERSLGTDGQWDQQEFILDICQTNR